MKRWQCVGASFLGASFLGASSTGELALAP